MECRRRVRCLSLAGRVRNTVVLCRRPGCMVVPWIVPARMTRDALYGELRRTGRPEVLAVPALGDKARLVGPA